MDKAWRRVVLILIIFFGVALAAVSACFAYPATAASAADPAFGGSGTEADPYILTGAADLEALSEAVNNNYSNDTGTLYAAAHYRIDVPGSVRTLTLDGAFTPIGTEQNPFNGSFDGNGVIIIGLTINSADNAGLFGYIGASGSVTRVGLYDSSVTGTANVGGIAGYNAGAISKCFNYGSVSGEARVGGLVGANAGRVENSFAKGTASASQSEAYLGGIVGDNLSGIVMYCFAQVDVEMSAVGGAAHYVGGVAGAGAVITNSYYNEISETVYGAIGDENNGYDIADSNNVRGLTGREAEGNNISALFNSTVASLWTRPAPYVLGNDTGYAAPVPSTFYEIENNVEVDIYGRDRYLVEVSTVRLFGIDDPAAFRQWGTETNPYLIENETQLNALQYVVNTYGRNFSGAYFMVANAFSVSSALTPIGSVRSANAFMGTFDGGGHAISGIVINTVTGEPDYAGLFASLNGATIKNLVLDSPSVTGANYAGVVAGRAINTSFENIFVTGGTVTANNYGGGLAGSLSGGLTENIFLDAEIRAAVATGSFGAVAGSIDGSMPSPRRNVRYFAPFTRGGEEYIYFSSTIGSALRADDENAVQFSFTPDENGDYAFTYKAEMPSGTLMTHAQFRNADDEILGTDEYTPQGDLVTVYLRFVRYVDVMLNDSTSQAANYVSAELDGDSFYAGQQVTLSVDGLHSDSRANNNYYVYSISPVDSSGVAADGVLSSAPYRYDAVNHVLYFTFTMSEEVARVTVTLNPLAPENTSAGITKTYDGTPAEYPDGTYTVPVGSDFEIEYLYGTQSSPTAFGSTPQSNASDSYYTVTVVYVNGYGVRVGSVQNLFNITRAALTFTWHDDSNVPTVYWGDAGAVTIPIRAEDITGIIEGDEGDGVTVSANVVFTDAELDVGTGRPVAFTFILQGADANNYTAPQNYSGSVGVVAKRPVYVTPGTLTAVYDGFAPTKAKLGSVSISNSVAAKPVTNLMLTYAFTAAGGLTDGDAGEYTLTVALSDAASDRKQYYEIYLRRAPQAEPVTELTFTIKPLALDMNVQLSSDKYTGGEITVTSASASGLGSDVFENLTSFISIYPITAYDPETGALTGDPLREIVNAGEYIAVVDLESACETYPAIVNYTINNYVFKIQKAERYVVYTDDAPREAVYAPGGVEFILSDFVTVDGATAEFTLDEGSSGTVSDGKLSIYSAGTVNVSVSVAGDENHNDYYSESALQFTVAKRKISLSVPGVRVQYGDEIVFTPEVADGNGTETISFDETGITTLPYISFEGDVPVPGVYKIYWDLPQQTDNYSITEATLGEVTVENKELFILPAENAGSVYGDELSAIGYDIFEFVNEEYVQVTDISLSGALSVDIERNADGFYPVGECEIGLGTLSEENPYYDLAFYASESETPVYYYEVSKRPLSVTVANGEKVYGSPDPEPVWSIEGFVGNDTMSSVGVSVAITRDEGEDAADERGNPQYYYYIVRVSVPDGADYYYAESASSPYLSITKADPVPVQTAPLAVAAKSTVTADIAVPATAAGVDGEALAGVFRWEQEDFVADFSASEEIVARAIFLPDNVNYNEIAFDVNISVIPIEITITFTGLTRYTYSASPTPDMTYSLNGVEEGDTVTAELTYSGDRVNAGSYTVSAASENHNYAIAGSDSVTVTISPAVVTVSFASDSYEITEGETPDIDLVYSGFAGGEGEEVLRREATFLAPLAPGTYTLNASGARADNYTFEYVSATLTVYRSTLADDEAGAEFEGSFPAEVTLRLTETDSATQAEALKLYQSIQSAYQTLSDKVMDSVLELSYAGLEGYSNAGTVTVTMPAMTAADSASVVYLYITNDGDIAVAEGTLINDDGTVTVTVRNARYILAAVTDETGISEYLVYIIIAGVALIIAVSVLIGAVVKRRRNARFIEYHDE